MNSLLIFLHLFGINCEEWLGSCCLEAGTIAASKWRHNPRDTRGNFSVCLELILSILHLIWTLLSGLWIPM